MGGLVKEELGTDTTIYNKLFYNVRGQLAEIRASTSYTVQPMTPGIAVRLSTTTVLHVLASAPD